MFIGYDFFNYKRGMFFETEVYHPSYDKVEIYNLTLDELFIDGNITIPISTEKPEGWTYSTVLDAKLQSNLEAGSISGNGLVVERIRFQKRKIDELEWQDVEEIPYNPSEQLLYETFDKYVQNDFIYEYSFVPITATVLGERVISNPITAKFEGVFLTDKNNNYRLLYNIENETIEHNVSVNVLEPLNSQYPIVNYGNTDYRSGGIKALFLSADTVNRYDGKVSIRAEKLNRDNLMKFLKNKKPKILRHQNGEMMLISIIGNPREEPNNSIVGLSNISFNFVEVGKIDSDTLRENGFLSGFEEE